MYRVVVGFMGLVWWFEDPGAPGGLEVRLLSLVWRWSEVEIAGWITDSRDLKCMRRPLFSATSFNVSSGLDNYDIVCYMVMILLDRWRIESDICINMSIYTGLGNYYLQDRQ